MQSKKEDFIREYKEAIVEWTKVNQQEILIEYENYHWKNRDHDESVRARNELERKINLSRKRNVGGLDLATLDEIYDWGFNSRFPLRDEEDVISITKETFRNAENRDYSNAARKLMSITGVNISGATKVIGLSDQERLCIYDSRVGHALRSLRKNDKKVVLCPPDKGFKRDYNHATKDGWAKNYERLIWTIEIIKDYLKEQSHLLRIADVEMALFMIGR